MKKKFIVVAGNIGSGKTTLTRYLSRYLGFTPSYESVDGNPYLADFYLDMERWSFPLQIYFLGKRFESHRAIVEGTESVIQDRSVYEDCAIFAENLRRNGQMTQRDFDNYKQIYTIMGNYFRPPDLVVYLKASMGTLEKRIAKRGRDYEASIPKTYLEQLNGLYDEWIDGWDQSPVVTLPADELDFVHSSIDCVSIFDLVETALDLPPTLPGLFAKPERASI